MLSPSALGRMAELGDNVDIRLAALRASSAIEPKLLVDTPQQAGVT
jgi:hypothetical protein